MTSIVPLHIKMRQCHWPIGLLFRKTGEMLCGHARLRVEISAGDFFKEELEEDKTRQNKNIRLQVHCKDLSYLQRPQLGFHDGLFGQIFKSRGCYILQM